MSSVARDPVAHVINNVFATTTAETAIKQWQLQCVGERDIGEQEITHQILSLKLYRSYFQTVTIALSNSKRCNLSNNDIRVQKSELEVYYRLYTFSIWWEIQRFLLDRIL